MVKGTHIVDKEDGRDCHDEVDDSDDTGSQQTNGRAL